MKPRIPAFILLLVASAVSMRAGAVDVFELATAAPEGLLATVAEQIIPDDSPALTRAFGLSPLEGLRLLGSRQTQDGRQVTRYVQTYRDIPVWGRQLVITRSGAGMITRLGGELVQGMAAELGQLDPALDGNTVLAGLRSRVAAGISTGNAVFERERAELVIHVDDGGVARLAYSVEFLVDSAQGGEPSRPVFVVDAQSGAVLQDYDALAHQTPPPTCSAGCLLLNENNLSGPSGKGRNANPWLYRSVTVLGNPGETFSLTISIAGGSGDADLYTRKGANPNLSAYDCRPWLNGNIESCTHTVTAGETWHIGLYAYRSYNGVSLTAVQEWQSPMTYGLNGTGPGGNQKTGQYGYGTNYPTLPNYPALLVGSNSDNCTMVNTTVQTVDLNNGTTGSGPYVYGSGGSNCFNDADTINGAYSPLNDAHYFGGVVYAMYQSYLGIPPLTFQLTMRVHYGVNYENAFWNGSSMTFGDGYSTFYPLVSLDVSSHEVSHGFTEQNSALIYSGQSGGMNEAFSDIAGEAAEYFMEGAADFLVGADIFKSSSGALRSMMNPPADGRSIDNVANYYEGLDVHYSSGIFNKAFYRLATTSGWNVRKAFEVFAWANMNCWVNNSSFQQGAQCVLDEALIAGYDGSAVVNAFAVVGISISPPVAPGKPALTLTAATYNSVQLAWADVANEQSYDIYRRPAGAGSYELLGTRTAGSTGYADNTVASSSAYDYKVVAVNGPYSTESDPLLNVTTGPAPDVILSVTAYKVKGFNSADLSWDSAGSVDTYRDGVRWKSNYAPKSDTDTTGLKGGMTRTYTVCLTGSNTACGEVTVAW